MYVYHIKYPNGMEYVGSTIQSPMKRIRQHSHLSKSNMNKNAKQWEAIKDMRERGLEIQIISIESFSNPLAMVFAEVKKIKQLGAKVCNAGALAANRCGFSVNMEDGIVIKHDAMHLRIKRS